MRKIAALFLLIFLSVVGTVTANDASPIRPEKPKGKPPAKGHGLLSVQASKPLPTVMPPHEYKNLPVYDFVPKSKREVLV